VKFYSDEIISFISPRMQYILSDIQAHTKHRLKKVMLFSWKCKVSV